MKELATDILESMVLAGARWPGNVRQLRNTIERLVVMISGESIDAADLPAELNRPAPSLVSKSLDAAVEAAETIRFAAP